MAVTRCIVLCAGEESRWQTYGGYRRKHFLEIDDETILTRTLRLLSESAEPDDLEVHVVVRRGDEDLYEPYMTVGTGLFAIEPAGANETEAYKYLSSKALWNPAGRTVVLMGDVWYSRPAMATIMDAGRSGWHAFGRPDGSTFTRKPHGEVFAQAFSSLESPCRLLDRLDMMYRSGTCRRTAAGWALYRLMIDTDPNMHGIGESFVTIDDFTDDFDSGHELEDWLRARKNWLGHFTEGRIRQLIKWADAGRSVEDICRQFRITEATFLAWRRQFDAKEWPRQAV